MKLGRKEAQYKPKICQGINRGCGQRQDNYRFREGLSVEIGVNTITTIEEEDITTMTETNTDPSIGLGVGQETDMKMVIRKMTGMTVGQVIEGIISTRTVETKGTETEV